MENEKEIFDHNAIDFITVSVEFCKVLEKANILSRISFVDTIIKLLPLLYIKALLLPPYKIIGEEMPKTFVTENLYENLRSTIAKIMAEKDDYLDVFVSDMKYSDQPIVRYISEDLADKIVEAGIDRLEVRSVLGCHSKHGVCQKCYGMGLARRDLVSIGESVGIIAAQSIGEPGTQLTMRTIHSGGVAGVADITQGLPRVEELFEARKPRGVAIISEIDGKVKIKETKKKKEVIVTGEFETKSYTIPFGSKMKVKDGDMVEIGDPLIEGSINPAEILDLKGPEGVYEYLISEVQKVYRNQGVDINDKHIEVIGRQMLKKVRIEDSGDTDMFTGALVDMYEFESRNEKAMEEGKKPATGKRILLGITKASLATDSFLSAASFQETTRVLTEAAVKGKTDDLLGLKENVIIGKLIPAGTGMKKYQDIKINTELDVEDIVKMSQMNN